MTDERKQQLYDLWENEVTAEDEEWRDDLTPEEAAMVEEWDNQYDTGTASLASKILDAEGRRMQQLPATEQEKQR